MRTRIAVVVLIFAVLGVLIIPLGQSEHLGFATSPALAGTTSPGQGVSAGASSNPTPTATPGSAAAGPPPSGTVLASDDFSNPSTGLLQKGIACTPDTWNAGYTNGQYQITSLQTTATTCNSFVRGTYADVSVAVDVRLSGGSNSSSFVGVGCRIQALPSGFTGYVIFFQPSSNTAQLNRLDAGTITSLANPGLGGAPDIAAVHHLQLTCSGTAISAFIDGSQIGSVQDTAYQTGQAIVRAGGSGTTSNAQGQAAFFSGIVDARFSNLVLTQP